MKLRAGRRAHGAAARAGLVAALTLPGLSCSKVPLSDVNAGFSLAEATWFAEEETLFVFYEVAAEQGLGDPSVIEVTYTTDDAVVPWTPLTDLTHVHTHVPVDCGARTLCGSASVRVSTEPRDVAVRLRYHRDGALSLDADTVFNVVGPGDPHESRSYVVYGVFDAANRRVQWRGRHQFPTIRNERASELGLRRSLTVGEQAYGTEELADASNPYGYGAECPVGFASAGLPAVSTDERAVFDAAELPIDASDATVVCAQATVTDATGTFTTGAVAHKNPEVRAAFPVLRSPVHDARELRFFLSPCDRTISAEHAAMQRQRLELGDVAAVCIDDWEADGFAESLAGVFTDAIEAARPDGEDMVLVIGLEQDERGVAAVVQDALSRVVPGERMRGSPRVVGAFVFDSDSRGATDAPDSTTLWCPGSATTDTEGGSGTCALAPDTPEVALGPLSFDAVPILPTRSAYLSFLETYSAAQAGEVTALSFRAPEFAATSEHVDLGVGVATFLNDEHVSADADDAFSYCAGSETGAFVFRSDVLQSDEFAALLAEACADGALSEELCGYAALGLLPLQLLPQWHDSAREDRYALGLAWDFPFLLRMEYETALAGSVSAFGLSVPFGVAANGEQYLGSAAWTVESFSLAELLTQCTRFCDHPTFDGAGVYHVGDAFRTAYAAACYDPRYPVLGDSGFPRDP